ncbi:MAG: 50S ribosomal protein L19 [Candidatus Nealsonbacteria bacterium]
MSNKITTFMQPELRTIPDIRPGDSVRITQKIKEGDKERDQVFEGLVIARKHGKGMESTITVRKIVSGVGIEKIFPLHSPAIEKMAVVKRGKVRRAKLYFLRTAKGKRSRLKNKEFAEVVVQETPEQKEELIETEPQSKKE